MKLTLPKVFGRFIRPIPLGLIIAAGIAPLLLINITGHIPYSPREEPHSLSFATVSEITRNILYAPFKSAGFLAIKFTDHDAYSRLAAASVAFVAALLLYLMLRKWFTARVSALTILMFATSSLFLHLGRFTSPEVMQLAVIPGLLLICLWILSKRNDRKLPLAALLLGLILYVPGSWLFVIAAMIAFRRYVIKAVKAIPTKITVLSAILFAGTLAPLAYSFAVSQRQALTWIGFDADQNYAPLEIAKNFLSIPDELFLRGFDDPGRWLTGTPVLDVFSAAMFVLGLYAFYAGYYPAREKLVYGALIISVLLIGLGGVATISLILPLIYIVIANGLAYMLQSWFTVFPRNPVARSIGIGILSLVVLLSCTFQLQRYFVAWPRSDDTISALKNRP